MSTIRPRAESDHHGLAPVIVQPRRILIVSHQFPPHVTGIGNVAAAEAAHLVASGNEVTVMTTGGDGGPPVMTAEGYRLVHVTAWEGLERRRGIPFPVSGPAMLAQTRRLVKWADMVHIHDVLYMPCWAAAWSARSIGRPTIITQHVATVAHTSRATRLAQRAVYGTAGSRILRGAARVTVVNGRVGDFVESQGVERSRIRLLPNGVDTDRFRPAEPGEREAVRARHGIPEDAVVALFVGRFVPKKGVHKLLAALSDEYVVVLVGGDRPAGLAADPRAIFLGEMGPDEVAGVYRASDVFVLPSESEGFPLSAQEAMASGIPVVLRHDDGYAPYQLDDVGVRFVDGSPESIRRELTTLATDPARRAGMGEAALHHARSRFAWREHTARLEALWDEVLDEER